MSRLLGRLAAILAVTAALNGCSSDPEKAKLEYLKSGDRYMAQKQYREAIVQFRRALAHADRLTPAASADLDHVSVSRPRSTSKARRLSWNASSKKRCGKTETSATRS